MLDTRYLNDPSGYFGIPDTHNYADFQFPNPSNSQNLHSGIAAPYSLAMGAMGGFDVDCNAGGDRSFVPLSFSSVNSSRLDMLAQLSDRVDVRMTKAFGFSPVLHTEAVFYSNDRPIGSAGMAPFAGWITRELSDGENAQKEINFYSKGFLQHSSDNPVGFVQGIKGHWGARNGAGLCWTGTTAGIIGSEKCR